ncbi:MAG: hypothetical protein Kow0029_32140 [Candidatus Rifleibacteriota bacterium]
MPWANELKVDKSIIEVIEMAPCNSPKDYVKNHGWVLISFHNALWQMLKAKSPAQAIEETIYCGGDTDTNAAICGALLGAIFGRKSMPRQWEECILSCKPEKGAPGVYRPRPKEYWPTEILNFAHTLLLNDFTAAKKSSERILSN